MLEAASPVGDRPAGFLPWGKPLDSLPRPELQAYHVLAMDARLQEARPRALPVLAIPQIVPSHACFRCDVCCRFPEADSFLRPYFTEEEITQAVAQGLDPGLWPDRAGSQIGLAPHPQGEGYLCPAFDPATSHCRIYDTRPLDCQIYPLALMWSADGSQVLLGWDSKCPDLRARGGAAGADFQTYAERVAALIEGPKLLEVLDRHRRLIGRFQDDVVVLRPLLRLTGRLLEGRKEEGGRRTQEAESGVPEASIREAPACGRMVLRPLTLGDQAAFDAACAVCDSPLAHYAFAPHYIWRGLLDYAWAEAAGHLCLFAASPDGLFMPLAPLAFPNTREGGEQPDFLTAVDRAFARMRQVNGESPVSRIENIPESQAGLLAGRGYVLKPKGADYLYLASDLAGLAGDRYKSQRAACNRFVREQVADYAVYRDEDREGCLALYRSWKAQQQARPSLDDLARHMLEDGESAHREALNAPAALGLTGRVVRIQGVIRGYTFGYARSSSVFCVLLEVADRTLPGLAAFLFREFCREAASRGYTYVNTMDDSGLPALAEAKLAYRPVRLIPSYVAME